MRRRRENGKALMDPRNMARHRNYYLEKVLHPLPMVVNPSLSDLTADQKQRRKEQNRAAQRAFRERKERYVKELEDQIRAMKASHEETVARLQQENIELRALLKRATSGEMDSVNDASLAMDLSLTKLQDTDVDMPTLKAESNRSSRSNPPPVALPTGFSQPTMVEPPVRQTSSAVACIRDKDGVSFCERLKEEVCSSAYNQLLSEPLFDASGTLNNESTSHPIPILTELLPDDEKARETHRMNMMDQFDKFAASLSGRLDQHPQVDNFNSGGALLTCRTVWERINAHPKFDRFDVEELCLELKKKAKCSSTGPIFLEEEVKEVLALMDRKS
ncbi:transcription factor PAP1-domain-containing protein [Radiomyces spectabilis]|uniref:transcription factor PAP1-domain-containing protein n=1 Tax=Radiomyces spectabilis TaxID=64574 RepID=UPI00221F1F66|nr:transcription factor PAP1-domain-containing protein [Radiomyces spectabilis]KAI8379635.1 transcription factor PAP1-domain-containing protein [Radiomyces spectabilis]